MMKFLYLFLISGTLCAFYFRCAPVINNQPGYTADDGLPGTELEAMKNQNESPRLEIQIPGNPEHLSWNTLVRYTISVSDAKDGESRYGEIDHRAVLLEVEYFGASEDVEATQLLKEAEKKEEHKGLSIMKRSTCFGCHADKTRLAGPSFAEISGRYESNPGTLKVLASHIIGGSTGLWGSQVMPSHPDLTEEEAAKIADYILEQGGNENRWIYAGLEGAFQTIEKPKDHEQGIYILTASYTSTSNIRGQYSVVLKIK